MYGFIIVIYLALSLNVTFGASSPVELPYLPVFGSILFFRHSRSKLMDLPRDVLAIICALLLFSFMATSLKSLIQFWLCLYSVVIFYHVADEEFSDRTAAVVVWICSLSILIVTLNTLGGPIPWLSDTMFVESEHGGLRYQFFFLEPNHFVAFVFFVALVTHAQIRRASMLIQNTINLGLIVIAVTSGSPLSYLGYIFYIMLYVLHASILKKLVFITFIGALMFLFLVAPPENIVNRIGLIFSGEDNSLNLRTWGSAAIAATTLIDRGSQLLGVGLGAGREALDGNPYMIFFAADQQSVLPSFVGSTLLETGYAGLGLVFGLFFLALYRCRVNANCFLAALFVIANCLSGSFMFDTTVWSFIGIALGISRNFTLVGMENASTLGQIRSRQLNG
jgi:hypothetical protein